MPSTYKVSSGASQPAANMATTRRQRTTSMDMAGSTMSFHDIHYNVDVSDPDKKCGSMEKEILRGIRYLCQTYHPPAIHATR